jgi:hypothetical protein
MEIEASLSAPEAPPPRKRGAQPGNTNSLKHGFYSHRLREKEADVGLDEVITLLHRLLRRAAEQTADPGLELTVLLKALDRISSAGDRLARLLRAQKELGGTSEDGRSALLRALGEAAQEMGIE